MSTHTDTTDAYPVFVAESPLGEVRVRVQRDGVVSFNAGNEHYGEPAPLVVNGVAYNVHAILYRQSGGEWTISPPESRHERYLFMSRTPWQSGKSSEPTESAMAKTVEVLAQLAASIPAETFGSAQETRTSEQIAERERTLAALDKASERIRAEIAALRAGGRVEWRERDRNGFRDRAEHVLDASGDVVAVSTTVDIDERRR